jgi:hypothetical protein
VSGYRDRYNTSYLEETVGLLSGVRTRIITTDSHGNERVTAAYSRPNFAGRMASHLSSDMTHPRTAENLGKLSGFAGGLGGTVSTIETLRDHPEEFIDVIDTFLKILQDLGLLAEFLKRLPESIQRQQELQNPYDPNDPTEEDLYEQFQRGWIAGYLLYFVVEAWLGTKGASALKNSDRAAEVVRTIDRTGHLRKGYRSYVRAKGLATLPAKKAGVKLAGAVKASAGYSLRSSRRLFAGVRTVGKEVVVSRQLRDIDASMVQALSARQQVRLRVVLVRKPDAESLFRKFDSEDAGAVKGILRSRTRAKAAVDLHERGVSAHRINELVEQDIDLVKHREGLRIYRISGKKIDQEGDVTEIIAHEKTVLDIYTESRIYPKENGKGIKIKGGPGEFDHLVVDSNGKVIRIYETKTRTIAGDAVEETEQHLETILSGDFRKIGYGLEPNQFDKDKIEIKTIGPEDGVGCDYRVSFTNDEIHALHRTITEDM